MTERAQALEDAIEKARRGLIGFAAEIQDGRVPVVGAVRDHLVLNLGLIASFLSDALLAVQPPPPVGSPTTAHVAPIVGKVWTHHDGVLPDGSVCRTADVDALIAERTAQLQAALFDEQASHEATKCRLVAAEQSHEAAGNRVIELLKSTPVEPAGASEPPSEAMRLRDELATRVLCVPFHGESVKPRGAYLLLDDVLRAMERQPAPVSPVEPTPPAGNPTPKRCDVCGAPATREFCYPADPWVPYCGLHCPQYATVGERQLEPVEPTPEPPTESVDEKASKWLKATMLSKGRDEDTLPTAVDRAVRRVLGSCSGESLHRHLVRLVRELAPTGAPAPCVWRSLIASAYPGCDPDNVSKNLDPDDVKLMRFCPYCGHPLTVER